MSEAPTLYDPYYAERKTIEELDEVLANTRRDLKALTKAKRNKQPSAYLERVAQSLVAQRGGRLDSAEAFLRQQKDYAPGRRSIEQWKSCLRDWWSGASADLVERLSVNPVTRKERVAFARAMKFMKDEDLHDWVAKRNLDEHLAPSAAAMMRFSEADSGGVVARFLHGAKIKKCRLQRLRRWRRRWDVAIGKIAERSSLPLEDRRRKARGDSQRPKQSDSD